MNEDVNNGWQKPTAVNILTVSISGVSVIANCTRGKSWLYILNMDDTAKLQMLCKSLNQLIFNNIEAKTLFFWMIQMISSHSSSSKLKVRYLGKNKNQARVKNVRLMRQSTFRNRPPKKRTLSRRSFMGGGCLRKSNHRGSLPRSYGPWTHLLYGR